MKRHAWTGLLLVLLLATACAALPPAAQEATQPSAAIANPASQNCLSQGGTLQIEQRGDGGQYGVCYFEDNRQCEEWALLRGECPVGGVKVTGYVTAAARYCAITGGSYAVTGDGGEADEQGVCTLAGGAQCDAADFYNGECDASTGTAPNPSGQTLAPPAVEVCNGMAQAMMQAVKTEVTQAGEAVEITDPVTMATGTACRALTTGTGEDFAGPDIPIKALAAVLTTGGWEEGIKLQAGGPTGMGTGFRSRDIVCLADARWQPDPSANCPDDQPISACKVTPEQQLYTVTLDCAQAVAASGGVGMANPASQNCTDQGGTLRIETRPDGGQYGVCYFEDNRQCEEWALLRGECPTGGVKVTGYTTDAARFCAISGGEYGQDGGCTFKDGTKCDAEAFYAGTCSPDGATGG